MIRHLEKNFEKNGTIDMKDIEWDLARDDPLWVFFVAINGSPVGIGRFQSLQEARSFSLSKLKSIASGEKVSWPIRAPTEDEARPLCEAHWIEN